MATKPHISGRMALQPIFAITENLASTSNNSARKNSPPRIKLMTALYDASLSIEKYGAFNNTTFLVQLNLSLIYDVNQCPPKTFLK